MRKRDVESIIARTVRLPPLHVMTGSESERARVLCQRMTRGIGNAIERAMLRAIKETNIPRQCDDDVEALLRVVVRAYAREIRSRLSNHPDVARRRAATKRVRTGDSTNAGTAR